MMYYHSSGTTLRCQRISIRLGASENTMRLQAKVPADSNGKGNQSDVRWNKLLWAMLMPIAVAKLNLLIMSQLGRSRSVKLTRDQVGTSRIDGSIQTESSGQVKTSTG
jgi:hypothetical protein